jgi:ABC-type transport system involved in cytochrome c biogenesis ATPase subunit
VAYALIAASASQGRNSRSPKPNKKSLNYHYEEKLKNVFNIGDFELLYNKHLANLRHRTFSTDKQFKFFLNIALSFSDKNLNLSFRYHTLFTDPVDPANIEVIDCPKKWDTLTPVFMPTRELLTIYPGFVSIYDNHYLEFDETYRDTCVLLGAPALKGKREKQAKALLKPLEEAMGGEVLLENGRFYLAIPNKGKIDMPMVAEGQRKLAMLAQLIATGALLDQGYLFWDEPEANLNPKLIKIIAKVILHLCNNGIQVFIASHSLFLLRELEILSEQTAFKAIKQRYFALRIEDDGVMVEQGDRIDDLQTLILLDEELAQSDRFMQMGD